MEVYKHIDKETGIISIYPITNDPVVKADPVAELSGNLVAIRSLDGLVLDDLGGVGFMPWDYQEWMDCDMTAYTTGISKLLEFVTAAAELIGIYNLPEHSGLIRGQTSAENYILVLASLVRTALQKEAVHIRVAPISYELVRNTRDVLKQLQGQHVRGDLIDGLNDFLERNKS